jgi:hypothetical protein
LIATLAITMACAAHAERHLMNSMGMFFSDDDFYEQNTNIDTNSLAGTAPDPFEAHIVVLECDFDSIAAYEVGISFDRKVIVLDEWGPNGWTNFGSPTNQLVGYQTPLPVPYGGAVLATLSILYLGSETVNVDFGPSDPSSVEGDGPAIANGADPTELLTCNYTSNQWLHPEGHVATINGNGIQFYWNKAQVDHRSWSELKSLF